MNSRLALGTVQFGLPYGIANTSGRVGVEEVRAILEHARSKGVMTLDTAVAYGDSEMRLGSIGVQSWQIVTKLPPVPPSTRNVASWADELLAGSLRRLAVPRIYGLLLHRSSDLAGPQGGALYAALLALRQQGKVKRIGVSIYEPQELAALVPHYSLDLVQAPFNILDRRLESSGWLDRLCRAGVEVHARSVFLQGLLLLPAPRRAAVFGRWQSLWNLWSDWLQETSMTAVQACLGFVLSHEQLARVVVGVDSRVQLQEILANTGLAVSRPPNGLMSNDPDLINPSRWNAL